MSVMIAVSEEKEEVSGGELHFVPCHLKEDHPDAPVSTYFSPSIKVKDHAADNEGMMKTASFRGRPLLGESVRVPAGYQGVVLDKVAATESQFRVNKTFSTLQLWNWDQIPSADDKIKRAFEWCAISQAIHKPVQVLFCPETESETASATKK